MTFENAPAAGAPTPAADDGPELEYVDEEPKRGRVELDAEEPREPAPADLEEEEAAQPRRAVAR